MRRSDGQQKLGIPADKSHGVCNLVDCIFWLHSAGNPKARHLGCQIIEWVSLIIDYEGWFEALDDDPLATPMPMGPKHARNISTRLKEAVVQSAGKGDVFRSGAHVMHLMKRFKYRKMSGERPADSTANTWCEPITRKYLWCTRTEMVRSSHHVFSIAVDGTRLSGRDMLFGSISSPSARLAPWCTPIAPNQQSLYVCWWAAK